MAILCTIDKTVLLATKREVTFFDGNGTNVFRLTLPKFDAKNTQNAENNEDDDQPDEVIKNSNPSEESSSIQDIGVSPNKSLLVITTSGDKLIYMYKMLGGDKHEFIAKRALARTSSALTFSSDSRHLYVADKTGDCYEYDCENLEAPGKWILGHLSMVLDLLATPDDRFLITCDRDEKIRVTNYPATHLIESYCLGHTEYVSAIAFLPTNPNELLVSISGDKTLRLWKYIAGIEVFEHMLPGAGLKMIVRKIEGLTSLVKVISEHNFEGSKEISSMLYEVDGSLVLTTVNTKACVNLHRFTYTGDSYVQQDLSELNKNIGNFVLDSYNFENISMLLLTKVSGLIDNTKLNTILNKNKPQTFSESMIPSTGDDQCIVSRRWNHRFRKRLRFVFI